MYQSYRATIDSELLFLPAAELQRMLREAAPHAGEGIALLEVVRLLERIPLFSGLSRAALRDLARQAERQVLQARSIVVRQGAPSGRLYLIAAGRAAVVRLGAAAEGKPRVIAQLGPEEFFGELELLRGEAPLASVVSVTRLELLAIPHTVIAAMLAGASGLARGLEQVGSGRMIELNRAAPAARPQGTGNGQ
jgi:putative peptide zinc metalloprotease protein